MAKSASAEPVLPSRGAMDRVASVVRRVERGPFNGSPGRRQPPIGTGSSLVPAIAPGTGISAGNMSTPTTGTVTLCVPATVGFGFVAGTQTVTVYNHYTSAVAGSALVWITFRTGAYRIVAGNCGASA